MKIEQAGALRIGITVQHPLLGGYQVEYFRNADGGGSLQEGAVLSFPGHEAVATVGVAMLLCFVFLRRESTPG
jgi:hypothetical protein